MKGTHSYTWIMKVLKFGGSSVGTPEIILQAKSILDKEDKNCIVVVSAFKGITNDILSISEMACNRNQLYEKEVQALRKRHTDAVLQLVQGERQSPVLKSVNRMVDELKDLMYGVFLISDLTPKTLDHLLSFGERLSSFIVTNTFENARCIDMRNFIRSDSNFGNAQVDFEVTNANIVGEFKNLQGFAIVPGYIAANERGDITTLGRGGSDYTAAIIAGALNAEVLEIWTDVDGFMTADPKKVDKAYVIGRLSYSEALELSHFGAKVLYTPTLHPAYQKNIPIRIKNTFNPSAPGTLISRESGNGTDSPIKGISSIDLIDLITIQGSGLPGVTGISMRLFSALAKHQINIILITQASSEYSISFAVAPTDTAIAAAALQEEFLVEMKMKNIIDMRIEKELSVIAIVGEKMKNTPGISANLFTSLGRNGISVIATAQGSSELNISVVIRNELLKKALNVIHEGFFLSHYKELHLYLVGTGKVGRDLLDQISAQQENLMKEHNLKINLVGISNSRQMLIDPAGINIPKSKKLLSNGEQADMEIYLAKMKELNLRNPVFIDCTASSDVAALYGRLFDQYVSVVTANKIACSSSYESYHKLKASARSKNLKFSFETNVGAGLPIIITINDLIKSGDKILGLEAVLSGTLNFIFNTVSENVPLSQAVKLAQEKGFSEPDPRIDLSGTDVMRKLLILSRESGYMLEEKDILMKRFLPDSCFEGNLDNFWKEIKKLDTEFEKERKEVQAREKRWRFVATLKEGKGSVELLEVDKTHPSYELADSNNIILITTKRYKEQPMVIRGYGAGAAVTAAGIFADIIRIANV